MSQTLSLYRLQQIDSQIDRVQLRIKAIQDMLEDDTCLIQSREQESNAKIQLHTVNQTLKQIEADVLEQRVKIEQTEASLFGNKGHSPKELLDLQNDVAAMKRHLTTLEDAQLEAMLAVEEADSQFSKAQTDLTNAEELSTKQHQGLHEERGILEKELEKLLSERSAVSGPIPPKTIDLYQQLRTEHRGIAVIAISDNSCSACGAGLSFAQIQTARASDQMAVCPSCGRILYGN